MKICVVSCDSCKERYTFAPPLEEIEARQIAFTHCAAFPSCSGSFSLAAAAVLERIEGTFQLSEPALDAPRET